MDKSCDVRATVVVVMCNDAAVGKRWDLSAAAKSYQSLMLGRRHWKLKSRTIGRIFHVNETQNTTTY